MYPTTSIRQRLLKRVHRLVKTLRGRPPALLDAHLVAAYGFRDLGAHDRSAKSFAAAVRVAPNRTDLRKEHAVALRHAGCFVEAETAFKRYVEDCPSDADAHLQLGHILLSLDRQADAADAFAVATSYDASIVATVAGLSTAKRAEDAEESARRGHEARDRKHHADAAKHYGRAIEIDETRTDLIAQLGNALKDDGQLERATTVYRRGIALFPDNADLSVQLGHTLKMAGRRADAIVEYREAIQKDPNLAHGLVELIWLGERAEQEANFDAQLRSGTIEHFLKLVLDVSTIKESVATIEAALPRTSDLAGVPIERYDFYREIFATPASPIIPKVTWLVIVTTSDLSQGILFEQLNSFRDQTLATFRVIYLGKDPALRTIVERASLTDPRFGWYDAEASLAAEDAVLRNFEADAVLLLEPDSVPHTEALASFALAFLETESPVLVSDDEAAVRTGGSLRFSAPRLRAAVDYESLLVANTLGRTLAIRRDAYLMAANEVCAESRPARRSSLLLHFARDGLVGHIPMPLIWRRPEDPQQSDDATHHALAVKQHVERHGLSFELRPAQERMLSLGQGIWHARSEEQRIAIVIPTRNNGRDVMRMVESLRQTATSANRLDILVIDNGSTEPDTAECLEGLVERALARTERIDEPFNWSRFNNRAVALSDAPYLIFANDDMEMLSPGWDARLGGLLERKEMGAIGARLLYGDGTVQHGGVLLGWHGAGIHDGLYQDATDPGPLGRWHLPRSVAGVTGAFLATRREVFESLGGFDETQLPIAWSDLDYCMSVRGQGLRVHWTPGITLLHYESKTRGLDHAHPDRNARPAAERAVMEARWGEALVEDPSVNPHWHLATLPFRLLRAPSQKRLQDHLKRASAKNPWLLPGEGRRSALHRGTIE